MVIRWLSPGNRTFLEVTSMVVTSLPGGKWLFVQCLKQMEDMNVYIPKTRYFADGQVKVEIHEHLVKNHKVVYLSGKLCFQHVKTLQVLVTTIDALGHFETG